MRIESHKIDSWGKIRYLPVLGCSCDYCCGTEKPSIAWWKSPLFFIALLLVADFLMGLAFLYEA